MSNISKQHREELLDKIRQIRSYIAAAPQDANTGNLLQYLEELTKEINGKKYGLVFEQHREQIDEILDTHMPVLTEQKDLFIDNGGEVNFLIEGDNLAALKLLKKTHKGKIDLIYIDPPYNTGAKSWRYNNDYVDKDDGFKHSKFSSFINERLQIANLLLKKNGIIAIAIDDYEMHNVRLLCDDIFGESNRLSTCTVVHNPGGRQDDKFFATSHEYMLVYAKNINYAEVGYLPITEEKQSQYKEIDSLGRYKLRSLIRTGAHSRPEERPGLYYPIYINPVTLDISIERSDDYRAKLLPVDSSGNPRVWRWGPKTLMESKDSYIVCKKNKNGFALYVKERESDNKGYKPKTLWSQPYYSSATAIGQIKKLFNTSEGTIFDYPKSLFLITDILKILSKGNSVILDFFAGSGTTGHAVMKLNSEDDGHRKYILCTNNENNICRDVTYERLKTVITGKRKDGSEYEEHHKASLKYYKIDFVPISDKIYYEYTDKLLLHIRELVELENGINFNGNNDIAIVLTDEEMEKFVKEAKNKAKVLYRGHDVLLTAEQEEYLKNKGIKVNVIPDYYYNELNR